MDKDLLFTTAVIALGAASVGLTLTALFWR
jgi:hypothetical protein